MRQSSHSHRSQSNRNSDESIPFANSIVHEHEHLPMLSNAVSNITEVPRNALPNYVPQSNNMESIFGRKQVQKSKTGFSENEA